MNSRNVMKDYLTRALSELGGSGTIVEVAKHIWENQKCELENSGDLLYTWQYDMRWAAQELKDTGILKSTIESAKGIWELS